MSFIKIHNAETGEVIEREMNDQELLQWQTNKSEAESKIKLKAQALAAKHTLLEKLGITEEEAKLLLS